MSSGSPYRSTIVLSEPLQRSIDRLRIHPYTIAHMRFNRRSDRPIELTDSLRDQIDTDRYDFRRDRYIDPYDETSDTAAYAIYQNHNIQTSESDPHTEQQLLDCILILSLRESVVEVDFETFCNLRINVPSDFYAYESYNESELFDAGSDSSQDESEASDDFSHDESEASDDENESGESDQNIMQEALHDARAFLRQQYEVRVALEDEDKCCVCLENFPNATFEGCMKQGVCCCLCASEIIFNRMNCPHCRAPVQAYTTGPLYPGADP
jgi:hypothetical protein